MSSPTSLLTAIEQERKGALEQGMDQQEHTAMCILLTRIAIHNKKSIALSTFSVRTEHTEMNLHVAGGLVTLDLTQSYSPPLYLGLFASFIFFNSFHHPFPSPLLSPSSTLLYSTTSTKSWLSTPPSSCK
jgi:hypothetical protein